MQSNYRALETGLLYSSSLLPPMDLLSKEDLPPSDGIGGSYDWVSYLDYRLLYLI